MPSGDALADLNDGSKPPRTLWDTWEAIERLPETAKTGVMALIAQVDDDFWEKPRREQVLWLLINKSGMGVNTKQTLN